jgi:hypothetical protein
VAGYQETLDLGDRDEIRFWNAIDICPLYCFVGLPLRLLKFSDEEDRRGLCFPERHVPAVWRLFFFERTPGQQSWLPLL